MKDNIEQIREVYGLEEDELTIYDTKLNLKQYKQQQAAKKIDEPKEEPETTQDDISEPMKPETAENGEEGEEVETDEISEPMSPNGPVMN